MSNPSSPETKEPAPGSPHTWSRRQVLTTVAVVSGGLVAVGAGVPFVGFIVGPLFSAKPEIWRPVGRMDSFKDNTTTLVSFEDPSPQAWAGTLARTAAWLRREGDRFTAFTISCTHLGCPVRWLADAELFMCPCHGGVYYKDGRVAAGPPPRPLPHYPVRVRDGQVEIQTSPLPIST